MADKLVPVRAAIDPTTFDMVGVIKELLPRGHVIHGYSSSIGERVIKILKEREYSDKAKLLGFGVDGRAERALGRSLLTYAMRERDGLKSISASQYPESDQAQVPCSDHDSRFDNIVWGDDFTLYQDGAIVVAKTRYGSNFARSPLEVSAPTALEAIIALTEKYEFLNTHIKSLPAIAFV